MTLPHIVFRQPIPERVRAEPKVPAWWLAVGMFGLALIVLALCFFVVEALVQVLT